MLIYFQFRYVFGPVFSCLCLCCCWLIAVDCQCASSPLGIVQDLVLTTLVSHQNCFSWGGDGTSLVGALGFDLLFIRWDMAFCRIKGLSICSGWHEDASCLRISPSLCVEDNGKVDLRLPCLCDCTLLCMMTRATIHKKNLSWRPKLPLYFPSAWLSKTSTLLQTRVQRAYTSPSTIGLRMIVDAPRIQ